LERLLALAARPAYAKVANSTSKQAAISPDGRRLYVISTSYEFREREPNITHQGLQAIDVATGTWLKHLDSAAESVTIAPDGKRLYLQGWDRDTSRPYSASWTEVVDVDDWRITRRIADLHVMPGRQLGGAPLLLASGTKPNGQTVLAILDTVSFDVRWTWADWSDGYMGWWSLQ
jgi:hypothetical protein